MGKRGEGRGENRDTCCSVEEAQQCMTLFANRHAGSAEARGGDKLYKMQHTHRKREQHASAFLQRHTHRRLHVTAEEKEAQKTHMRDIQDKKAHRR